jgi:polysaccharide biosynthesis protein PslJ
LSASVNAGTAPNRPRRAPAVAPARSTQIYWVFLSYPVFWLIGLPWLWGPLLTFPMLFSLLRNLKSVKIPRYFGIWLLFLAWVLLSSTQLVSQGVDRWLAFAFRSIEYYTGTVMFLYFYNSDPRRYPWTTLVKAGAWLWAITIVLGFTGLIFPGHELHTIGGQLLPESLKSIQLVSDMANPKLSQFQNILGFPIARPAAPFFFTNGWAANVAVFTPFALMAFRIVRREGTRLAIALLLVLGLIPFVSSVSRGAWIALIVGCAYAGARIAIARGNLDTVVRVATVGAIFFCLVWLTPLHSIIDARLAHPHSNKGRAEQSLEAARRATQSPWIGYGAPLPSEDSSIGHNIGTHGQIWLVMFSHGFPALLLYLGWFGLVFLQVRRCRTQEELWMHVILLIGILMMPVYGLLSLNFDLMMAALGLVFRDQITGWTDGTIPYRALVPPGRSYAGR